LSCGDYYLQIVVVEISLQIHGSGLFKESRVIEWKFVVLLGDEEAQVTAILMLCSGTSWMISLQLAGWVLLP
jgi:hypothetical protein